MTNEIQPSARKKRRISSKNATQHTTTYLTQGNRLINHTLLGHDQLGYAASLSANVIAMKEPVFTTNDKRFDGTFGFVVVNFKAAIRR